MGGSPVNLDALIQRTKDQRKLIHYTAEDVEWIGSTGFRATLHLSGAPLCAVEQKTGPDLESAPPELTWLSDLAAHELRMSPDDACALVLGALIGGADHGRNAVELVHETLEDLIRGNHLRHDSSREE
jgi:hypothetical protein